MSSKSEYTATRPGFGINDKASRAKRVLALWGTSSAPGELYEKPSSIAVRLSCNRQWVTDCLRRHGRIVGGELLDNGGVTS